MTLKSSKTNIWFFLIIIFFFGWGWWWIGCRFIFTVVYVLIMWEHSFGVFSGLSKASGWSSIQPHRMASRVGLCFPWWGAIWELARICTTADWRGVCCSGIKPCEREWQPSRSGENFMPWIQTLKKKKRRGGDQYWPLRLQITPTLSKPSLGF